ncbi:MAG: hypothetical protein ACI9R8_001185 [Candidatus Paceibacteria bacterium]|jgi:hypothetical protein
MHTDITHSAERLSAISRAPFFELPVLQKSLLVLTTHDCYSAKAESTQVQYRRQPNDFVVVAINNANRAKPTTPTGRASQSLMPVMEDISGCSQHKIPRNITIVVPSPIC